MMWLRVVLPRPGGPNQVAYLKNILGHDITFGIGPAGTGKTYLAVGRTQDILYLSLIHI